MGDTERPMGNIAEEFHQFTKRSFLIVIVLFLSNLITAVSTLVTAVTLFRDSTNDWREAEYVKLQALRAGQTLDRFKEKLGTPAFRSRVRGGPYSSNIFQPRKDYWVEAISDESGATLTYTVTSCNRSFRPTFSFRTSGDRRSVTLNETPMFSVLPRRSAGWIKALPLRSGGVPGFVYQITPSHAGSDYRAHAWGLSGACPWFSAARGVNLPAEWDAWRHSHKEVEPYIYPFEKLDNEGRELMRNSLANTYTESSPNECLTKVPGLSCEPELYPDDLGVDVVLVR
ncbi:ETEC_3214 domain-containing protein [Streptomyces virginiae]